MVPFTLTAPIQASHHLSTPFLWVVRQLSDCHGNQKGNLCEALLQWERTRYFIQKVKKKKKEIPLKWAILIVFSGHWSPGFNSETSSPGQVPEDEEGGAALDPRPSCAAGCCVTWSESLTLLVWFPLPRAWWAAPPSSNLLWDECLARACPRVRGLGARVHICLSVSS